MMELTSAASIKDDDRSKRLPVLVIAERRSHERMSSLLRWVLFVSSFFLSFSFFFFLCRRKILGSFPPHFFPYPRVFHSSFYNSLLRMFHFLSPFGLSSRAHKHIHIASTKFSPLSSATTGTRRDRDDTLEELVFAIIFLFFFYYSHVDDICHTISDKSLNTLKIRSY